MKLNPDGSIEGTPRECAEYKRIQYEQSHSKPFKPVSALMDLSNLVNIPVTRQLAEKNIQRLLF